MLLQKLSTKVYHFLSVKESNDIDFEIHLNIKVFCDLRIKTIQERINRLVHLCVLQDTWLIQNSWALKRYSCLKDISSVEDNSFAFYNIEACNEMKE